MAGRSAAKNVDEYISRFPPQVQAILQQVRLTVATAAPEAEEAISYGMPAFRLHGALVYFAAFRNHLGFYPPVRATGALARAVAAYAGPKGNLKFPLDEPIPFDVIGAVVKRRVRDNRAKAAARRAGNRTRG